MFPFSGIFWCYREQNNYLPLIPVLQWITANFYEKKKAIRYVLKMAFDCSFYLDTRKQFFYLLSYINCNTISLRTGRGRERALGRGGGGVVLMLQRPKILDDSDLFGQQEKFGQIICFKKVSIFLEM